MKKCANGFLPLEDKSGCSSCENLSEEFREPFCNGEGVIECTMLPNVEKCSSGKVSKCIKNFKIVNNFGACQKCDSV